MKASGDYYVTVIEDTRKNEIIGAASLIIERKFIHNCAVVSQESSPWLQHKVMFNDPFAAWTPRGCGGQWHLPWQTAGKTVSLD